MSNHCEHTLPSIPGYTLIEQLYSGTRTLVYRALREAPLPSSNTAVDIEPAVDSRSPHPTSVVIKVLRSPYPSFSELVRFRNQYTITKNLPIDQIVKPLALMPWERRYALVMEDVGGVALTDYLQGQGCLSVEQGLNIALQLTEILHQLSQHQVVHKDIKPANILIQPDPLHIWLIDFSIASLLPKENQTLQSPQGLEGTLAYLAPEQTGRMNRAIDYRTDFYALGVLLYEVFAGQLPFTSRDPLELIHCHMAKVPVPLNDLNLPRALSDIVLKLMAKNAEDRYQSALGLKHDLQHCLSQWQETGEIAPFELGLEDRCDRFLIPEKLYGRDAEIQTLLAAFERVSAGSAALMLVAGFSGIGKTAVVNEVHKPIVRQRGYFIKGKFDQFNRNIPFSAFVQAFRSLMGQLLSESDAQLHQWNVQILQAVGDNAQVLLDVIPELEHIIGPQPAAAQLEGSAAQNRFNLLFQKFIAIFTTPEHPLVLFLDDLQWADSASLNLINVLLGRGETAYLLMLGAYRDNEVFPAHPLMLTLSELEKNQATLSTLTLAPLTPTHITQLVADTLTCSSELAQPLAKLVAQKTQGNPFFANQFLTGLHADNLITFKSDLGHWQCDLVAVRDAALTDDVVEFIAGRLQKLSEQTQALLKLAACIGNQFNLETLAIVQQMSSIDVAFQLWPALEDEMVLPVTDAYKFFQGPVDSVQRNPTTVPYRFLHDRVQQAAYSLIPEQQKAEKHLTIGRLLLQNTSPSDQKDYSFQIANQVNFAIAQIIDPHERKQLAQLNLFAGQKATSTTAYSTAIEYFKAGIELLNDRPWQQQYELTLALHSGAAEAAYLNGDFEQMTRYIETVLAEVKDLTDRLQVYEIKLLALKAKNQLTDAIQLGLQMLQWLGIELPTDPTEGDVLRFFEATQSALNNRDINSLLNLPAMTNPDMLIATRILCFLGPVSYNAVPKLFSITNFKQVQLALDYGNAPAHPYAYACMGAILCGLFEQIDTGYDFGQLAIQLCERLDDKRFQASATFVALYFTQHFKGDVQAILNPLLNTYERGLETGDIEHACWAIQRYGHVAYSSGAIPLSELDLKMSTFTGAMRKFSQNGILKAHKIHHQVVLNWLGESKDPCRLVGDIYDETVELKQHIDESYQLALFYFYLNKLILTYSFSDNAAAIECVALTKHHLEGGIASPLMPIFYMYSSLAQLTRYSVDALATKDLLETIAFNQEKLKKLAAYAPNNCQYRVDLVEAERYRVLGDRYRAIDCYDRAIAGAQENQYIREEALANELAAKFYLDWGKEKVAAAYMQDAYYGYARWGADAKINDLERRYSTLLQPILQSPSARFNPLETLNVLGKTTVHQYSTRASRQSSDTYNNELDFTAILRAAKALTTTVHLDELLQNLGQIILQQSGADRLILVLPRDPELSQGQLTWVITLVATPETHYLGDDPLASQADIPVQLIQYVKNTQTVLFADTVDTTLPVVDHYLVTTRPKSFLCSPLFHYNQLTGILYLQSSSTAHLIAPNRLTSLNFLFSQAAIALHNAQLYESVALKSRIIEASVNGIAVVEGGQYIYLNRHYLGLVGYERSELLGQSWEQLYGPEQVQSFHDTAFPLLQQQGQWSGETIARRKDGSTFAQEVSLFSLADGKLIYICRDISERVRLEVQRQRAETELQESLVQLQASNQELEAFAYSIAHDLRAPLRAINGYSHTLMEDYGDRLDDIGHEYFERICSNTNRMADLIDDLLHLSQVSRLELRCEPVNLSGLAQRLLAELQATQPNRSVDITIEADLVVMADPMLINVVMQNLLENAWKFSCDRTPTQIEVGHLPSSIPLDPPQHSKQIQETLFPIYFVRDNGVGFDMTYADKLFGIFQRLHGMEEFPGTGIGLVIVKRAIQRHGGHIWATAKVGQGATFYFTLPISDPPVSKYD